MKKKGDLADPLDGENETKGGNTETGGPLQDPEGTEPGTEQPDDETSALPHIETHTETQSLKCILTQDEIKQAGERMARAEGEKKDHEATMKSVVSRYKAKIDESVAVMSSEAEKVRSGYEFRTVGILVEMDHSEGKVTKTRKDTFEIIEDRKMSDFELQREIRF